ncbi:hypothetical protein Ddye_006280 [Dipteronia dyeriana]|uniref:Uncharacterized protein n=1 Tax=Dipteronia dyeriana TaxID=168575 RepID=A0AAD9XIA8_9ROSI|nr:hypothetical protein Ddye_006280 [Dipteronia dyeriana]
MEKDTKIDISAGHMSIVPHGTSCAVKFLKEDIDVEMEGKFDRMFMNTIATGDHVWAPLPSVLPSDGCEPIDNDTIVLDNDLVDEDPVKVTHDAEGLEKKKNKRVIEEHETKVIKINKSKKMGIKGGKIGGAEKCYNGLIP